MGSNISRDHIALEAMKVILETSFCREESLMEKVRVFLGGRSQLHGNYLRAEIAAKMAYEYADAMLEERMKDRSLQKSEDNEAE